MEGTNGSTSRSDWWDELQAAIAANGPDGWDAIEPGVRQSIIDWIAETLLRFLPIHTPPEGIDKVHKIAVRFEEKTYTAATCQADYLNKITLKMLSMEPRSGQAPADVTGELQNLNLETESEEDETDEEH